MLNSGVKLDRALAVMRRNASGVAQTQLIVNIHDAIRRGESLSDAMSNHPQVFSSLYVNLVKLGESSGTLSRMFFKLAEDIKFQSELKRKTRGLHTCLGGWGSAVSRSPVKAYPGGFRPGKSSAQPFQTRSSHRKRWSAECAAGATPPTTVNRLRNWRPYGKETRERKQRNL